MQKETAQKYVAHRRARVLNRDACCIRPVLPDPYWRTLDRQRRAVDARSALDGPAAQVDLPRVDEHRVDIWTVGELEQRVIRDRRVDVRGMYEDGITDAQR